MTPFPGTFIVTGDGNNVGNPNFCLFAALITSFPDKTFMNKETTDFINEEAIGGLQ